MQRSIINYQPVIPLVLLFGLIFYESITSLFTFVTPLAGVIFLYLVTHIKDKEKMPINIVLFIYLTYFEFDRGLIVFSSLIFFIIYYEFIHSGIVSSIACKNCLKIVIITIYYLGIYILNLILSLIFDLNLPMLDVVYVVYLVSDILLVLIL